MLTVTVNLLTGTSSAATVKSIVEGGFIVGGEGGVAIANGAVHGNGVYTATGPTDPMVYGKDTGCVILCRGLIGRQTKGDKGALGGDSWVANGHEDWMIFRTAQQLLPKYLVFFRK